MKKILNLAILLSFVAVPMVHLKSIRTREEKIKKREEQSYAHLLKHIDKMMDELKKATDQRTLRHVKLQINKPFLDYIREKLNTIISDHSKLIIVTTVNPKITPEQIKKFIKERRSLNKSLLDLIDPRAYYSFKKMPLNKRQTEQIKLLFKNIYDSIKIASTYLQKIKPVITETKNKYKKIRKEEPILFEGLEYYLNKLLNLLSKYNTNYKAYKAGDIKHIELFEIIREIDKFSFSRYLIGHNNYMARRNISTIRSELKQKIQELIVNKDFKKLLEKEKLSEDEIKTSLDEVSALIKPTGEQFKESKHELDLIKQLESEIKITTKEEREKLSTLQDLSFTVSDIYDFCNDFNYYYDEFKDYDDTDSKNDAIKIIKEIRKYKLK